MNTVCRPRRSVLYVPADKPRAIAKARTLPVDGLIFDLEDAVLPAAKTAARAALATALADGGFGHREVVVRINGLDTPWGPEDLAMAIAAGAGAVLLPKVAGPAEVRKAAMVIGAVRGLAGGPLLWAMAETARGILDIDGIAGADPRLAVLVMGTADLGRELRLADEAARPGLVTALSLCVLAARAHHLDILDGVYPDLTDDAGFRAACRQGRALGFDGKTLVHPGQIAAANEIFGIAATELAAARALVAAWDEAAAAGRGIAVVAGRMVEGLHAAEARRLLALDAAIRQRHGLTATGSEHGTISQADGG